MEQLLAVLNLGIQVALAQKDQQIQALAQRVQELEAQQGEASSAESPPEHVA